QIHGEYFDDEIGARNLDTRRFGENLSGRLRSRSVVVPGCDPEWIARPIAAEVPVVDSRMRAGGIGPLAERVGVITGCSEGPRRAIDGRTGHSAAQAPPA